MSDPTRTTGATRDPGFAWLRGNARMEPIPPTQCTPDLAATNNRKRNRRIVRLIDALVTVGVVGLCAYAMIGGWL